MVNIITGIIKKAFDIALGIILWPFKFVLSLVTKVIAIILAIAIILILTAGGMYYIGDITSFEVLINTFFEMLANQILG